MAIPSLFRAPATGARTLRSLSVVSRSYATATETFKFQIEKPFLLHRIPDGEGPKLEVEATKDELRDAYKLMTRMRRMEMTADQLYKQKLIRGFCHLNSGQEAVAVGMEAAITKADNVITSYRCHGFALARGNTVHSILAELMGRITGATKGKGGSMHIFGPNFYGGNGIVGAQVPVGTGIAFTQKYNNSGQVTFTLYGDGAANQGQVFESFNLAKLWDLPCVYVCENNRYGMGTAASRAAASHTYYTRGDYIPGILVNGMDFFSTREACRFAREWCLAGKGPLVLEMNTYRYGGHSMSDPGTTYRTREEIQHMRSTSDPISGLRHLLMEQNVFSEQELKQWDKDAKTEVDKAVAQAKKDAFPDPATDLATDIYVPGTFEAEVRGRTPFVMYQHN